MVLETASRDVQSSSLDVPQEVPESRLRDNLVGRKDAHTVDLGGGLRLRGEVAADDLVFLERHLEQGDRTVSEPSFIQIAEVPSSVESSEFCRVSAWTSSTEGHRDVLERQELTLRKIGRAHV